MAAKGGLKLGTENKRNVIIAGVLFCVVIYLVIHTVFGGSPDPAPSPRPVVAAPGVRTPIQPTPIQTVAAGGSDNGPAAKKVASSGLDPALHLEKLVLSESIEYAGRGRNIFSADSAPVVIDEPVKSARNEVPKGPAAPPPYVAPQPPAIDLKFFGYTAGKDGKREAFLLRGEDIFEAAAGEIVDHRFKVVAVDARSVQVTDLSYNNTQTLPLLAN
jgi:hypothetical protein